MSAIILRRVIRSTGNNFPRFDPELCCTGIDSLETLAGEELNLQFVHHTGRSSSWRNQANLHFPEGMMTPFVTASYQIPREDTTKLPISAPKEDTGGEDSQESDAEGLAILKTVHRTLHAAEESLGVDYPSPDAQTIVHEWCTERDIPRS
jgi:hypothetical protein